MIPVLNRKIAKSIRVTTASRGNRTLCCSGSDILLGSVVDKATSPAAPDSRPHPLRRQVPAFYSQLAASQCLPVEFVARNHSIKSFGRSRLLSSTHLPRNSQQFRASGPAPSTHPRFETKSARLLGNIRQLRASTRIAKTSRDCQGQAKDSGELDSKKTNPLGSNVRQFSDVVNSDQVLAAREFAQRPSYH